MGSVKGVNVDSINTKIDNVSNVIDNRKAVDSIPLISSSNPIDEFFSFVESINDITESDVVNLLQANGINYNESDIASIDRIGGLVESIVVKTNNGEEFVFTNILAGYKLSAITLSDGTVITCDIPKQTELLIQLPANIGLIVPIRGMGEIEVDGYKTNVYWVGNDVDFETFKENVSNIKAGLSEYPDNVLDYVSDKSRFKGFYIGTFNSTSDFDVVEDADVIAYAKKNNLIYVNVDHPSVLTTDTIIHEIAHVLDYTIGRWEHNSESDKTFINYYETYKQMIQQIPLTGYPAEGFPDGVPAVEEFYAQAVAAYLEYPEELEALMPEVYDYIDDQFSNLKGGIFPW